MLEWDFAQCLLYLNMGLEWKNFVKFVVKSDRIRSHDWILEWDGYFYEIWSGHVRTEDDNEHTMTAITVWR